MPDNDHRETVASIAVRCLLYTLIFVAVGYLPALDIATNPFNREILFTEYSYTQLGQSVALLAGIVASALLLRRRVLSQLGLLIVALLTCALVRESDSFLDSVADGLWQMIVLLILVAVTLQMMAQKRALQTQVAWLGSHFSFGLMLAGFAIIMGFSRVFGRGEMWRQIMGESYSKTIKYFAEESVELMGYAILMIGVIEFSLAAMRHFRDRRIVGEFVPWPDGRLQAQSSRAATEWMRSAHRLAEDK